ncbi:hypothetical protein K9B33_13360 [Sphingobium sp. 3R8]|jgi:hypothetical protein|uniref:hypothetical protein n=1 Tax=Sphingobium sp. 3R8 TaxID=2874921 RepID=UPI001CCA0129|nr:hypothetical protein [Sphingobium sp. 3R8]MBZ9648536.1 hypothetical protein [Sphingobium sp. 3R8]
MENLNADTARQVVTNLGRTQNAIDGALKKLSVLTTDVLNAFDEARLNDAMTQPTLEGLADGFKMMVDGRRAFVTVHQELIDMKFQSNLRHAEIGCEPGPVCPWKIDTAGDQHHLRVVA